MDKSYSLERHSPRGADSPEEKQHARLFTGHVDTPCPNTDLGRADLCSAQVELRAPACGTDHGAGEPEQPLKDTARAGGKPEGWSR